jgi:ubiquinone/menaquinone biosynthesis C-methylase UbiE
MRADYVDDAHRRANQIANAFFQVGDIYKIPFSDAHFDLVWSKYLMQFIRDPMKAIAECVRVTKSGGTVM